MSARPRRDSAKCAIVNMTVSFNVEDDYQGRLLQHVQTWTNFSGTIKRLIAAQIPTDGSAAVDPFIQQSLREVMVNDEYDPVSDLFGS